MGSCDSIGVLGSQDLKYGKFKDSAPAPAAAASPSSRLLQASPRKAPVSPRLRRASSASSSRPASLTSSLAASDGWGLKVSALQPQPKGSSPPPPRTSATSVLSATNANRQSFDVNSWVEVTSFNSIFFF